MIDLRSDTITKPCDKMLKAMINATVGDDVYGEDPTVLELEQTIAKYFGMEKAMFFHLVLWQTKLQLNFIQTLEIRLLLTNIHMYIIMKEEGVI